MASIETELSRIATSLEALVVLFKDRAGNDIKSPASAPAAASTASLGGKPAGRPAKATPPPAPVPVQNDLDPLGGVGEPTAVVTQTEVHQALRQLMDNPTKGGLELCKKIMVKHGAAAAKPVISSIPPANYAAVLADVKEALAK